jgi:16S rRNA G966 N2-methylase RsmD
MDWRKYCKSENWHHYASLFPAMDSDELDSLAENIKENGLQEPIKLFEGKVLDGRNRALACAKAGEEPTFVQWHRNGVSPLAFVIAENLERRHLSTSQRAGIAAMLLPELRKEARARQSEAGRHGAKGGRGHNNQKPLAKKCAKGSGKSTELAAARFGISARTVEKAVALGNKKRGILRQIARGTVTLQQADKALNSRGQLHERFVAPPFSVLDARQGYWQKRKQFWRSNGVYGGHNQQLNGSQPEIGSFSDNSAFDPVLAECVYRLFAPKGGRVLDPFAGEPTKGIVAAKSGLDYTGVDVRREQVEQNRNQARKVGVSPKWCRGDSAKLAQLLPHDELFDLVFTSPPYYNLEVYSKNKKDGSSFKTLPQAALVFLKRQAAVLGSPKQRIEVVLHGCMNVSIGCQRTRKGSGRDDFLEPAKVIRFGAERGRVSFQLKVVVFRGANLKAACFLFRLCHTFSFSK